MKTKPFRRIVKPMSTGTGKTKSPPRIHVTTLGCSKNVYDSEILLGQLKAHKARLVDDPEEADVLIINTCGFIHLAKQESVDAILEAERLKQEDPSKKIVVCGCLVQRYAGELRKELPAVDAFFGTEDYQNILKFLNVAHELTPEHLFERRYLTTPGPLCIFENIRGMQPYLFLLRHSPDSGTLSQPSHISDRVRSTDAGRARR